MSRRLAWHRGTIRVAARSYSLLSIFMISFWEPGVSHMSLRLVMSVWSSSLPLLSRMAVHSLYDGGNVRVRTMRTNAFQYIRWVRVEEILIR